VSERVYDVFGRSKRGAQSVRLGSLAAPDDQLALLYATQLFGRRGEHVDIYVGRGERLAIATERAYQRVFEHHALRSPALLAAKRSSRAVPSP